MIKEKYTPLVFLTTTQVAKLLGISRVAVQKKIKTGKIPAQKINRSYLILIDDFKSVIGEFISPEKKKQIDIVVQKVVEQYKETFRLLGLE